MVGSRLSLIPWEEGQAWAKLVTVNASSPLVWWTCMLRSQANNAKIMGVLRCHKTRTLSKAFAACFVYNSSTLSHTTNKWLLKTKKKLMTCIRGTHLLLGTPLVTSWSVARKWIVAVTVVTRQSPYKTRDFQCCQIGLLLKIKSSPSSFFFSFRFYI